MGYDYRPEWKHAGVALLELPPVSRVVMLGEGELRDIRYWNPLSKSWQGSVPTFPFLNYCGLRGTAVNLLPYDCYFFIYWYGFDSLGRRLYQRTTKTTLLRPGGSITDSITFFCELPGIYRGTCLLYAWPIGEAARLADSIGTLEVGVPVAYATGVVEVEAEIDTWWLWDAVENDWVRPSPTLIPFGEDIGIRGRAWNKSDFTIDMRMDIRRRSPSGKTFTKGGDVRSVPPGLMPGGYPFWDFVWEADEWGEWKADLILYAGHPGETLSAVHRIDNIQVAQVATAPTPPPEEYEGAITTKLLEYDESEKSIPVDPIPFGLRGLIHIKGRNDTDTKQKMGISWMVRDPDGRVAESYYDWESFSTSPGKTQEFLGDRFNLNKAGIWTISVSLLMNRDSPVVVDSYDGILCSVSEGVEPPPPPPEEVEYSLVLDKLYEPEASTYVGEAEVATLYFDAVPGELPGWPAIVEKISEAVAENIVAEDGTLLRLRIYRGKAEWYLTKWKVEVVMHASPFPWAIVIPLIVILLIVIGFAYITQKLTTMDWGKAAAAIPAVAIILGVAAVAGTGVAIAISRRKSVTRRGLRW